MSIADKLLEVNEKLKTLKKQKAALKAALEAKGLELEEGVTLAEMIEALENA